MSTVPNFVASEKAQTFVSSIAKGKYDRQITSGIEKFANNKVADDMARLLHRI